MSNAVVAGLLLIAGSYGLLRVLASPIVARSLWLGLCVTAVASAVCFHFATEYQWQAIFSSATALRSALVCFLIAANGLTMPFLYGADKWLAKRKWQRIPEVTLHIPAFFGAAPGALLAQKLFRHKTRKTAFRRIFYLSLLSSAILYAFLVYLFAQ